MVQELREHGVTTTLPLPHYVHDALRGWIPKSPTKSPKLKVQFFVDRAAYAVLNLAIPRFKAAIPRFKAGLRQEEQKACQYATLEHS